eukprot:jgi/Ulvmu1/8202/UM041_0011.1
MPAKRALEQGAADSIRKSAKTGHASGTSSSKHSNTQPQAVQKEASIERFGANALSDRNHGAGQIKSVHVTNFMCHTNMKVDFQPHVNFISGPNGSGKSAILQALQYCLGVRANQTGRGTSNAAYLKHGADQSTAQVTIWNTGADGDAFHPEKFGPYITIHKTLSAKGHTSTKVLDARGHKTQLTKADDIRRLLSHLSVNAANPSIVLTQDHARGLLSGDKVESKLYDLMFQSLEFERTLEHLSSAREEIRTQTTEVEKFKEAKEEYERRLQDLQERHDCATQAKLHREVAEQVEDHMAWTVVHYLATKLKELEDGMKASGPAARQDFQAQLEAVDDDIKELQHQELEVVAVINETERRTGEHRHEREVMRSKKKDVMSRKNKATKALEQRMTELADFAEKKKQADAYVHELQARGDGNDAVAKKLEKWQMKKNNMADSLEQSQKALTDERNAYSRVMEDVTTANDRIHALRQEHSRHRGQIEAAQRQLVSMQRSSGPNQQAAMFFAQADNLLKAIQMNSHRFKCTPIGPVGAHLSLMDDRFSATVVGALEKLLPAWIVDNRADYKTLMALLQQLKLPKQPTVYIMRFDVPLYNISPHQMPHESILTIYRVLKVKPDTPNGHVLFNLLVDHGRIENVGLMENENVGRQLLDDGQAWRNLSNVWCNGQDGPVDMKRTGGGARSIWPWPRNKPVPSPLLTADKSAIIQSRRSALMDDQERLCQLEESLKMAEGEHHEATARHRAVKTQVEQQAQNVRRLQQSLSRLESDMPEFQQSADDEIAEYLTISNEAGNEMRRIKPELATLEEEKLRAEEALKEVEEEKHAYDAHANEMKKEIEGKLKFQMHVAQQKAQKISLRDVIAKNLAKIEENERAAEAAKAELMPAYTKALEDAETVCTAEEAESELPDLKDQVTHLMGDMLRKKRIDIDDAFNDKEIMVYLASRLHSKADKYQESANATLESLNTELETVQTTMETNMRQTSQILSLVDIQKQSFMDRKHKYIEIRNQSCLAINSGFKSKLKTGRNWKGQVIVDHDSGTVSLSVTPNKGVSTGSKKDAAVKDMKALSGGERSFTSVSFMLSLGSEIRTPFFAMDEFDVFMDAVNRKVSLTSILKFAWDMQDKQFILLSPLDMAVVEQSRHEVNESLQAKANGAKFEAMPKDFIRSYQMQPPREGARAHY